MCQYVLISARRLRAQAQQFGVQDVRVEAVPSNDMGRFVLPAVGLVAAAVLAGAALLKDICMTSIASKTSVSVVCTPATSVTSRHDHMAVEVYRRPQACT